MIDGGLGPLFRKHLPEVDWVRIETWGTGQGVPDVNYCYEGVEGWVEFKGVHNLGRVPMRAEQIAWGERRLRHGGRVWVAVRLEAILFLFTGFQARGLHLRSSIPQVKCSGGPSRWDWEAVKRKLCLDPFSFSFDSGIVKASATEINHERS